ncbi:MAG: transporter substrate-binding domain-containing protein [Lachnospiraceae bacterium]|nr:transporter substrate-binding domain-containing protein [Lachnospiraceae bacterium]MBQ3968385.1 transporter substrate-binding domain-containing protein [Lachnospiraceae bacterium]
MKLKKVCALAMAGLMLTGLVSGCGKKEEKVTAKVIDIELTKEQYAFGIDKNNAELLKSANDYLDKIKEDGTFDKICDNYFGSGEPTPVKSAALDSAKDQLVIATNAAFEPFEYTKGDSFYGIDMEMAKGLADYLGKELVIQNMDFDAVLLSVNQGKADMGAAGLTVKPDREELVTFSKTYYNASQKIIVPSNDTKFADCKTAEDVEKVLKSFDKSVKIGVQQGTTGQFYVEGDKDWGFDGLNVTAVPYKNGALAVQDMLNKNVDYVIIDSAPAASITKSINELK